MCCSLRAGSQSGVMNCSREFDVMRCDSATLPVRRAVWRMPKLAFMQSGPIVTYDLHASWN